MKCKKGFRDPKLKQCLSCKMQDARGTKKNIPCRRGAPPHAV